MTDISAPLREGITWHVDDLPWTPLTGLFIKKAGFKQVIDAEFTNNAYSIELTTVGPGGSSPTHVEPHAHVFYVLSGHGEVTVGAEVREVRPGSVSPIAAGDPHSFRVLGDESLEMLVIYHPPRRRGEKKPSPAAPDRLHAVVHAIERKAKSVLSIELRPGPDTHFPAFEPGAHILVHLPNGMVRNYSLSNSADERDRYVLGVLNEANGRGGSRWLHEELKPGSTLEISHPRNHFGLNEEASHSVLIAGGIGITPLLSMLRRLHAKGRSVDLFFAARSRADAAFIDEVAAIAQRVQWHFDDESAGPPDLQSFIAAQPADSHYYACGPSGMLDAFEKHCAALGRKNTHVERFTGAAEPATPTAPYDVTLSRSGRRLRVTSKSLLQTLLDAGVSVDYSCEQGVCGTCKTRVISGDIEHCDQFLSAEERSSNDAMLVCVSGCRSKELVLDL